MCKEIIPRLKTSDRPTNGFSGPDFPKKKMKLKTNLLETTPNAK